MTQTELSQLYLIKKTSEAQDKYQLTSRGTLRYCGYKLFFFLPINKLFIPIADVLQAVPIKC